MCVFVCACVAHYINNTYKPKTNLATIYWERKFGKFGEFSAICQTKAIQISSYN